MSIAFIKSWILYPELCKTEYYDTHLQAGKSEVQVQYVLHSDFKIGVSYKKRYQKNKEIKREDERGGGRKGGRGRKEEQMKERKISMLYFVNLCSYEICMASLVCVMK